MSLSPEQAGQLLELLQARDEPEPAPPPADLPPAKIVVPKIEPLPPPPERKRARLYSPERRGFMRATRELDLSPPESPFADEPTSSASSSPSAERLRALVAQLKK